VTFTTDTSTKSSLITVLHQEMPACYDPSKKKGHSDSVRFYFKSFLLELMLWRKKGQNKKS